MTRRNVVASLVAGFAGLTAGIGTALAEGIEKLVLSKDEWKKRLNPQQYHVLREAGTERAFTSPLNDEKRKGTFHCAGCDLELFASDTKYDSGTGWPSFFDTIPGHVETSLDFKLIYPRTEYHCARCGGHQGHVFKDGPQPTGLRYCNNGVALTFKPADEEKTEG
ncbi:MAG: peptide-methionine (R)-S-oxide reductase [Hyphomicrobiales bacterium]|nr:MAG: peptide-methionine (R)-S-oxide reductase [Hyphomicrobiales bacterium]